MGQVDAAGEMTGSDRAHLHHLSVYKLHPVVFAEQARLAHPVVLLDGKAMSLDLRR